MIRRTLVFFLVAAGLLAFASLVVFVFVFSEPPLHYYAVPRAPFLIEPQQGTRIALRVTHWWDTRVEMTITNDSCDVLYIKPAMIKLIDKAGNEIRPDPDFEYDCVEYPEQQQVALAKSESCRILVYFAPYETVESPALDELTLIHEGVVRGDGRVPISIFLKKIANNFY